MAWIKIIKTDENGMQHWVDAKELPAKPFCETVKEDDYTIDPGPSLAPADYKSGKPPMKHPPLHGSKCKVHFLGGPLDGEVRASDNPPAPGHDCQIALPAARGAMGPEVRTITYELHRFVCTCGADHFIYTPKSPFPSKK